MAAAFFQHRVAVAVLDSLAMSVGWSTRRMASEVDAKHDTLMRKLYGQNQASLCDMLGWALVLGVDVLPVIESKDDLLP